MSPKPIIVFLVLILLTLSIEGAAIETHPGEGACPQCKGVVHGTLIEGLIERPPPDPDLCVRFLGDQPYGHIIWSCPACGFSAYSEDEGECSVTVDCEEPGVSTIEEK